MGSFLQGYSLLSLSLLVQHIYWMIPLPPNLEDFFDHYCTVLPLFHVLSCPGGMPPERRRQSFLISHTNISVPTCAPLCLALCTFYAEGEASAAAAAPGPGPVAGTFFFF